MLSKMQGAALWDTRPVTLSGAVASASDFREYENGVADILASVVGEDAEVTRNVRLPSKSGVRPRQVDVLVTGTVFGFPGTRLIVDCKRRKRALDAPDVEAFVGLIDDVGGNMGLLVSASGAGDGAVNRALSLRGIRVKALSVAELARWATRGDRHRRGRFAGRRPGARR